jgi:hypothetical protein
MSKVKVLENCARSPAVKFVAPSNRHTRSPKPRRPGAAKRSPGPPFRSDATGQITDSQRRAIFGLAKQHGLDREGLRLVVEGVVNREIESERTGVSTLTFVEANRVIDKLGGVPFAGRREIRTRSENGVKRMARPAKSAVASQLDYIAFLASQRPEMRGRPEALTAFIQRMIKKEIPGTTEEANVVIEALKAMNRRDGLCVK